MARATDVPFTRARVQHHWKYCKTGRSSGENRAYRGWAPNTILCSGKVDTIGLNPNGFAAIFMIHLPIETCLANRLKNEFYSLSKPMDFH